MTRISLAGTVCLLGILACSTGQEALGPIPPGAPLLAPDQTLSVDATVRFSHIEGGCWLLVEQTGSRYVFDLPEFFRRDGLKVHVTIRGSRLGSFCGPGVTIDSIRLR